ncbi:MAG: transglycosylase domain-containing protein [Eubacteriales bacterium]|nr:transglycosylase domain-containing protein [Eubacteriales bacterium]
MDFKSKKARRIAAVGSNAAASVFGGVFRTAVKVIMSVLLIFLTTGLLFTCIFAYYVKTNLSSEISVDIDDFSVSLSSTVWYYDSNGEPHELTTLASTEDRIWVDFDDIPDYMKKAAVAIEDKRFYEHKGVDWYRTVGAFANMFLTMKNDFGGSTITQQLLKNTTGDNDISVQRKLREIFRALELEKTHTKDEILESYLNMVYFGGGSYGVYTAAKNYLDKDLSELSLAECAAIIGITNNPSRFSPFASEKNNKERQEIILYEMYDQEMISYEEYEAAVAEELVFARGENDAFEQEIYSYYVEMVTSDVLNDLMEKKGMSRSAANLLLTQGGLQIYSCIDMNFQNVVDSVYQDPSQLPQAYYSISGQPLQSAMIIADPYTGDIKAVAGGTGTKTQNYGWNYATDMHRPAGSSFKPVAVYGPAFDLGLITQSTKVLDEGPDKVKLEHTNWLPHNANYGYMGAINIRTALINSINTVSAQILDKLTPAVSYEYLTERFGYESLVESDINYAPLCLGQLTYGVTVREMAQAYTAFVNDGMLTRLRTYSLVTDSEGNVVLSNETETSTALKQQTARNITDMLYAAASYGTGSEASFGWGKMPVAGKTGTTSFDQDRWFVGYTPYYLAAVWTGYESPEAMYFYGNPACQIWKKIMMPLHENLEILSFPTPTWQSPTNLFGDVKDPEESEEPEETEDPEVTETPETTPTPTPSPTPAPSDPPSSDPPAPDPSDPDESEAPEEITPPPESNEEDAA